MSQIPAHRPTALVVCPGRGSYNRTELGYLARYHSHLDWLWKEYDVLRKEVGQIPLTEMDNAKEFSSSVHVPGENAAALIYSCSYGDYTAIDAEKYEIVAVTGNSMGWYTALGVTNALSGDSGFRVANTMGSMMKSGVIGGQFIYPIVNENWQPDESLESKLHEVMREANEVGKAYESIRFGGYAVIGADDAAMAHLMKALPKVQDRFPMKLPGHAAFHTPLLNQTSEKAFAMLGEELFSAPQVPLIDGRGKIWQPLATKVDELYAYTLGHQVTQTYDFSTAVSVGLKEFAPDVVILLGPGEATGGALGQIMIQNKWRSCQSKQDFIELQEENPFVISMGRPEQRKLVTAGDS